MTDFIIENGCLNQYTGSQTDVIIPEGVCEIGDKVFFWMTSIINLTIPDGVIKIGSSAFWDCSSLRSVRIPDSVIEIENSAFSGCSSLSDITIPEGIIKINDAAFADCSSLISLTLPESIRSLGHYAFGNCQSLTSINIPKSIEYIGRDVFKKCNKLDEKSLKEIDNALLSCTKFDIRYNTLNGVDTSSKLVIIPNDVKHIGGFIFKDSDAQLKASYNNYEYDYYNDYDGFKHLNFNEYKVRQIYDYCDNIVEEIILPDSIKDISEYAFHNLSKLKRINLPQGLKEINKYTFKGCNSLEQIEVPEGVKNIENWAFEDCESLKSVKIPDSVQYIGKYAFMGCNKLDKESSEKIKNISLGLLSTKFIIEDNILTKVISVEKKIIIPENVKVIDCFAFAYENEFTNEKYFIEYNHYLNFNKDISKQYEENLFVEEIVLPESIETIEEYAFAKCERLKEIILPDSLKYIDNNLFQNCTNLKEIIIPESVKEIGDGAFSKCSSLKNIIIPNGVKKIGRYAFMDCSSLISITIPSSVEKIGEGAFSRCTSLKNIVISEGVKSIGGWAFTSCESLTHVELPSTITAIRGTTFRYCDSLRTVIIPESVTKIGDNAFMRCNNLDDETLARIENINNNDPDIMGVDNGNLDITNFKIDKNGYLQNYTGRRSNVIIPDGIVKITDYVFLRHSTLKSVTIPESVREIGYCAFYGCPSLSSVTILEGVTKIGSSAFAGCPSLNSISIPESMIEIGECAFEGCRNLSSITIPEGVKKIGKGAFDDCSNLSSINCSVNKITAFKDEEIRIRLINTFLQNIDNYDENSKKEIIKKAKSQIWLYVQCVKNGDADTISLLIKHRLISLKFIDEFIEIATANNNLDITAMLLDYKQNAFTSKQRDKLLQAGEDKALGLKGLTQAELKRIYTCKKNCDSIEISNYKGKDSTLIIPGKVGKYDIIIGQLSKRENSSITEVILEEGVIKIGSLAFKDCKSLNSITIPDSVTKIGNDAFLGCNNLDDETLARIERITNNQCELIDDEN